MQTCVTVVDYGVGNLLSVSRALEHCGARVILESSPLLIAKAERLVLPGVGAFGNGMAELRRRNLIEPIRNHAASGRPLLGICLGMQMLFDCSDEFGTCDGLGLIPGRVRKLPAQPGNKLPNIGWQAIRPFVGRDLDHTLLEDVAPGEEVYFVHSYYASPQDSRNILAQTLYGEFQFCSVVEKQNITGCQFHLEKSGVAGLAMVKSFLRRF